MRPSVFRTAQGSYLDIPLQAAAFALLIGSAALFSACEYAIVNIRKTRFNESIEEQSTKKRSAALKIIDQPDEYLFACQIGIVLAVLGLGWMGHAVVEQLLQQNAAVFGFSTELTTWLAFLGSFIAVALSLIIFGELLPKTLAVRNPEGVLLSLVAPLRLAYWLLLPLLSLFRGIARLLARLFGIKLSRTKMGHTEEELKLLLSDSLKSGQINPSEYDYVNRIFEFDERLAKEIMVPRMEMSTLDHDMSLREVLSLEAIEQFTRYPIVEGDKDHVLGVVNMKHLLSAYVKDQAAGDLQVSAFTQPVIQVIETTPLSELLLKIQRERIHMAILRDEYGGTSGLVTIEDILEEIVGDIQDEFDLDELPDVQKLG